MSDEIIGRGEVVDLPKVLTFLGWLQYSLDDPEAYPSLSLTGWKSLPAYRPTDVEGRKTVPVRIEVLLP
mgnify:CR=1 FL=1